MLPSNGAMKPIKNHIDNWRVQHFLVVPRHGCFQINATEPLHRFDDGCRAAGDTLFRVLKEENGGALVYTNALIAVSETGRKRGIRWRETCFPELPDGRRISFEYIAQVTGQDIAQVHALYEAFAGQQFLEGLA